MTQEELQKLKDGIADAVRLGSGVATIVVPQYAAYIAIGKAVGLIAPDLVNDVIKFFEKDAEPTPEEVTALHEKIEWLMNPEKFYKS